MAFHYRFTGSYELPVQFSDIKAEVFIYTGFTIKYYIALMIFDVGFSLMISVVLSQCCTDGCTDACTTPSQGCTGICDQTLSACHSYCGNACRR